jgi:glycosyltransferase involved in cell wall biosynthesis
LAGDFEKLAPTTLYSSGTLGDSFKPGDVDLIYSNTISNGNVLSELAFLKCPVISHVHELGAVVRILGEANLRQTMRYTSHYIAVSDAVRRYWMDVQGVDPEDISLVHEFIPRIDCARQGLSALQIKEKLGIPQNAFIVGGAGGDVWRKGQDLFVQLAVNLRNARGTQPIHYIWLGEDPGRENRKRVESDLELSGLQSCMHFVGSVNNPLDYMKAFDVFAMTSREDPFPLVNLEAASLNKPIICFADAGGSPEFVAEGAGFVVPFLDVSAFAEKILWLRDHPEAGQKMGDLGARRVEEHYLLEHGAESVVKVIEKFLAAKSVVGSQMQLEPGGGLKSKGGLIPRFRPLIRSLLPERVMARYYSWRYPHRTIRSTLRDVIWGECSGKSQKKLCIFAHYDPAGRIEGYVRDHIAVLRSLGFDVALVSSSPMLVKTHVERVRAQCRVIISRENVGLDFASWKAAMDVLPDVWQYERILLTNDSIFGPFQDLGAPLARMEQAASLVCGLNDSHERGYHLQSFFLYLKKPLFDQPVFQRFWREIAAVYDKEKIVADYEVGFSQGMRQAGETLFAAFPISEIEGRARALGATFQYNDLLDKQPLNASLYMWDILLREFKYPYIKRELLVKNRMASKEIGQWKALVSPLAQNNVNDVEDYIKRMRIHAQDWNAHA